MPSNDRLRIKRMFLFTHEGEFWLCIFSKLTDIASVLIQFIHGVITGNMVIITSIVFLVFLSMALKYYLYITLNTHVIKYSRQETQTW